MAKSRVFGVVAVIRSDSRFLVVRRSLQVSAPGTFCFPGGRVEQGETEEGALRREMMEELGVAAQPVKRVWRSVTPWNVELAWWSARVASGVSFRLCPKEVSDYLWISSAEMRWLPGLLESNHHFLDSLDRGEIVLGG